MVIPLAFSWMTLILARGLLFLLTTIFIYKMHIPRQSPDVILCPLTYPLPFLIITYTIYLSLRLDVFEILIALPPPGLAA
jgi:hypothetical protein